jgi:STE24 endopeptidase
MQLCIVIVVVASLAAADLASPEEVVLGAPKLCAVLLSQCLVVVVAWAIACQTGVDAANDLMSRHQAGLRLERRYKLHLGVWLVMSLCILTCFDWARMTANSDLARQLLINRVLLLMPLISPLILSWDVFYEAECLLDARLPSQSRWSYVFSQMRSFLFVPLVPVLFVTGCCDAFDHFAGDFAAAKWAGLVPVIPLLLVLLAFPIMLRMLWQTKSLENGPLRCQLERLSRRLGFSINDILVWQTQQRVLNAAVTGLVPRLRYVLLTDRLIRELQVEAMTN